MQEKELPCPDEERYPGGYVPSPTGPPSPPATGPANIGERHPVNVSECGDRFVLEMSVPGACAADFFIRVDAKGILIGRNGYTDDASSEKLLCRHEFDTNPFRRYIPMPGAVDAERITASYANGILKLLLPKGVSGEDCPVIQVPVY
jgi:HSP20 family molecular chaperone IbpA